MTMPTSGSGSTRRAVLKNAAALSLGTGVLVVTGQLITATPAHAVPPRPQFGWRYCNRCKSLVWGASPSLHEQCPHPSYIEHNTSGSFNYGMHFRPTNIAGQDHWAYCSFCYGMFYWGSRSQPFVPLCPSGGGNHNGDGSHEYIIPTSSAGARQENWRHCTKCHMLFWGGAEASSRCPAGGTHTRGSSANYWLAHE
jgi:hypothetical protein